MPPPQETAGPNKALLRETLGSHETCLLLLCYVFFLGGDDWRQKKTRMN